VVLQLGLGMGLTTPHIKNELVMKHVKKPQTWTNLFYKLHKLWNEDMRLGMRNIRSLYRAGLLMTVSKERSKYELDLVGGGQVGQRCH
jgi:hypothetical protein